MPVQTRAMTQGRRPEAKEPPTKKQRTAPTKKPGGEKKQPAKPRKQPAKKTPQQKTRGRKPKAQQGGDDKKEEETKSTEEAPPAAAAAAEGKKEKKQSKENEKNDKGEEPEEVKGEKEAEAKTETITEGKEAPAFLNIPNEKGTNVSLKDYAGKYLVLYFYAKDNTPACKKEGQKFNELYKDFQDLNCEILGVSGEDSKSHQDFIEKEKFAFSLLADTQQKVTKLFNIAQRKRVTFLIGADSKIVKIWNPVKNIDKHPADVLNALKGCQSTTNTADNAAEGSDSKKPEQ